MTAITAVAPLESLVLDLLEWIGPAGRTYDETMTAWKTSCPQLAVWEEANVRGLVVREGHLRDRRMVRVSRAGVDHLGAHRP